MEHIGSTAIAGLPAKPIIDMLMAVESLNIVPKIKPSLKKAGYQYRPNGSDERQVLFVKGPEARRTHYLHIIPKNSIVWRNDLFFRDYLRAHPITATGYQKLKEKLALKYPKKRKNILKAKLVLLNQ